MVSLFLSVCLWSVYKLLLCGCFLGRVVSLIVEQEVLIRPHPANNICVLEKCTRCGTRGWWPYTDMSCRAGSFERRPQYCNAQKHCVCLNRWALLADLHFHFSFLPFLFAFKKSTQKIPTVHCQSIMRWANEIQTNCKILFFLRCQEEKVFNVCFRISSMFAFVVLENESCSFQTAN